METGPDSASEVLTNQYDATINDARITYTILFNSGYITGSNAQMMSKFKKPVAYFLGGPKDMAQKNVT
jgi:hypothetical protein